MQANCLTKAQNRTVTMRRRLVAVILREKGWTISANSWLTLADDNGDEPTDDNGNEPAEDIDKEEIVGDNICVSNICKV